MDSRRPGKLAPLKNDLPTIENIDPVPPGLSAETDITINGESMRIRALDLEKVATIGEGQYGRVEKRVHRPSGRVFAVKLIAIFQEHINRMQIKRDLEVGKNTTCPCVVMCYGGLLHDSEVLVLMELMDISLENLRVKVYGSGKVIPGEILAYIIHRVVTGLEFLRSQLSVMHRDVKPSNILADRRGLVKVCDFGISGDLVKSFAASNVGTNRYLAPERINPPKDHAFRIQSDVWSLGLSVIELATGKLCYANLDNILEQLQAVVFGEPPRLPTDDRYSEELQHFTSRCLVHNPRERADYVELLKTDLLQSVNIIEGQKKLSTFLLAFLDVDN